MDQVDKHASTTLLTREFLVTSCVKIVDRTKSASLQAKIEKFLERFTSNYSLELHERSNEYLNILREIDDLSARSKVLGPIPPPPVKKDMNAPVSASGEGSPSPARAAAQPAKSASPQQKGNIILFYLKINRYSSLSSSILISVPHPTIAAPAPKASSLLDDIDLLSQGMTSSGSVPPMAAAPGSLNYYIIF